MITIDENPAYSIRCKHGKLKRNREAVLVLNRSNQHSKNGDQLSTSDEDDATTEFK